MQPMIQQAAETVVLFGPFQFQPYRRLLLQGERPVRIGSRALDILQVLIARPGEIVAKEEIIARVWGDTVVEEINLRVHIAALRRALGEGHTGERYIANVPLRGYGFIGVVEALQAERRAPARRSELPVQLMGLVGRDALVRRVQALLPQSRLLTLVGPGGMGKTAVAIRVCEGLGAHFAGIHFLDLSGERHGDALRASIAQALDGPLAQPTLLLLDSCEHLAAGCAEAAEQLLREHPLLSILATSREPLHAEGEQVLRLPPLELPEQAQLPLEQALDYSAVQLSVRRAQEVCDRLLLDAAQVASVIDICRRLDGIPLAIEMAARQVDSLGLVGLPALLRSPVHLGMPGRRTAPPRQQSLRATYDWSFNLLSGAEQRCLGLLARLGRSFTMEMGVAALSGNRLCADCSFSAICQLAEKSLLQVEQGENGVHYSLPNTARTYVLECLPPPAAESALAYAPAAAQRLTG